MRNFKKVLSLCLVLVMLCSMMSISAFASSDDPEVTVYVTTGMFSQGGYDDANRRPIIQTYLTGEDPADHPLYGFTSTGIKVKKSEINARLTDIRDEYAPTGYSSDPNVLDAIICALAIKNDYTVSCGWDSITTPNGGYINSFDPTGIPQYNDVDHATKYEYVEGVLTPFEYTIYSGTGLKIAYNTSSGGTIVEPLTYSTEQEIVDGMSIVLDYSSYVIYYR